MTLYGYITLKEAEKISGVSVEALKKQCQAGRIRGAVKEGGTWFVPQSEIIVKPGYPDDDALKLLVIMAEAGASAGVTVYTNGLVIEGRLISTKAYVQYMRQNTKIKLGVDNADVEETLDKTIAAWYDNILDNGTKNDYHFLHLEHVTVKQGGGDYEPQGALLRLHLDSIDGFQLGTTKVFPMGSAVKDGDEGV